MVYTVETGKEGVRDRYFSKNIEKQDRKRFESLEVIIDQLMDIN